MRHLIFVVSILFSTPAISEEVVIGDTGISFDAPDGFTELSQEIQELKWDNGPFFAMGNNTARTTINFVSVGLVVTGEPLSALKQDFENMFNRGPVDIKWISSEIIQLNGKGWVFLEMTWNEEGTDLHNIMLITTYKGEMLLVNFNSTKDEFPSYENALRNSIDSIKLQ